MTDFTFPKPPLPKELDREVSKSVGQFEERLAPFRMFAGSQIPIWLSEYRDELERIARLAFASGEAEGKRSTPSLGTDQVS